MRSRRRQAPWMHRRSRYLIAGVAGLGALNTAYLTATKLFGGETTCPTDGCKQVLSSSYAEVFGVPLALFGLLAYLSMAAFALAPLFVNPDRNKQLRTNLENWTWMLLFAGSTAMLVFSAYLMYIMFSQFVANYGPGGICYYCLASAIFALALFVLTLLGRAWEDRGQLFFTGIIVAMVTIVGTLGVYSGGNGGQLASADVAGATGPQITTVSGASEIALAQHLTNIGAKMYGAYWCPHCHDQKQLFGQEAAALITYIECAPDGQNSQASTCQAVAPDIKAATGREFGFPTWEVNGRYLVGTQSLQALADASGYQGPREFSN
ncbi:vitamin K epoxide reductase family protein [Thermocoleostomius sinensis]|uniref:Vitamin K epoxide reductase family protein n=1 Tax=Thermocoleostomius sinensis A174 TaxID=2016057 RepID=A0A9E8ZAW8_9CYAN|nr:vitamin K epoxide reductase family protein [Thermocoleostomius sinensis]WAL58512.1 vitamin K epoxide reductase family protein [Thermocoleostomius sinensis A174]